MPRIQCDAPYCDEPATYSVWWPISRGASAYRHELRCTSHTNDAIDTYLMVECERLDDNQQRPRRKGWLRRKLGPFWCEGAHR